MQAWHCTASHHWRGRPNVYWRLSRKHPVRACRGPRKFQPMGDALEDSLVQRRMSCKRFSFASSFGRGHFALPWVSRENKEEGDLWLVECTQLEQLYGGGRLGVHQWSVGGQRGVRWESVGSLSESIKVPLGGIGGPTGICQGSSPIFFLEYVIGFIVRSLSGVCPESVQSLSGRAFR